MCCAQDDRWRLRSVSIDFVMCPSRVNESEVLVHESLSAVVCCSGPMSRIQPAAFTSKLKAMELSSQLSAKQVGHLFQAFDANNNDVELDTFLSTAAAIQTLLGAVANDAAPTTKGRNGELPRRPHRHPADSTHVRQHQLSTEEQLRAATEAARKQKFSKSCEESSRQMDAARARQRSSYVSGAEAMCARSSLTVPIPPHLPMWAGQSSWCQLATC